jgi:hypothetical protein
MEVFMNVLQYFAGILFVVCLLGFIGVYSLILVNAAKHVGAKMSKLVMELVSRTVGSY